LRLNEIEGITGRERNLEEVRKTKSTGCTGRPIYKIGYMLWTIELLVRIVDYAIMGILGLYEFLTLCWIERVLFFRK